MADPRLHKDWDQTLLYAWNLSGKGGGQRTRARARADLDHLDPRVGCAWCEDLALIEVLGCEPSRQALREEISMKVLTGAVAVA